MVNKKPVYSSSLPLLPSVEPDHIDPFAIEDFTATKVFIATLSVVIGVSSGIFTIPVASKLIARLGFTHPTPPLAENLLGVAACLGNSIINTQQTYDSLLHIYQARTKNKPTPVTKSGLVSLACAFSGAFLIGFLSWEELAGYQQSTRLWLAATSAFAGFAEFSLGADALTYVITKQLWLALHPKVHHIPVSQDQADMQTILGSFHEEQTVTSNQLLTQLANQRLIHTLSKLSNVLQILSTENRNQLAVLWAALYSTNEAFRQKPGLFFSLLLLGRIPAHYLTLQQTATVINALHTRDTTRLLTTLREQINQPQQLVILNPGQRIILLTAISSLAFVCLSYIWDTASFFEQKFDSRLGWLISLLGVGGAVMMFALGVDLLNVFYTQPLKLLPSYKVASGAFIVSISLFAALLEASLCAFMANNTTGLNWLFAIIGCVAKGLITNAAYSNKFLHTLSYTADSAYHWLKPTAEQASDPHSAHPDPDSIINALSVFIELLQENSEQLPIDLAQLAATMGTSTLTTSQLVPPTKIVTLATIDSSQDDTGDLSETIPLLRRPAM